MFCSQCGNKAVEGQQFCPACGNRLAVSVDGEGANGTAVAGRTRTPWEDRDTRGFFGGLSATIKESLFSPSEFFRNMGVTGGLSDPLLYAMIVGVLGIMASYLWQVVLHDAFKGLLPQEVPVAGGIQALGSIGLAFVALFVPFLLIISLFLWSGFLHVLLLMVSGARNGFEATFRAVSYSCGSYLFMTIPVCGSLIATVWSIVITIIGLKEAHGTSGGKATFAVLFPMILCCLAVFLFAVLLFGTVAASLGTMKPSPWR